MDNNGRGGGGAPDGIGGHVGVVDGRAGRRPVRQGLSGADASSRPQGNVRRES